MPLGDDVHKVQAQTLTPDLLDVYGEFGAINSTYNPTAIGEWGWMYATEAIAARNAGDVLIHSENTPISLERGIPMQRDVSVFVPGDGSATHIVYVAPGIFDGGANGTGYTITVTMAIDGGGDLTAVTTAATAGADASDVAADLAAQVVAGVTLVQDPQDLTDVFFTPDTGAFTKFEVATTDSL